MIQFKLVEDLVFQKLHNESSGHDYYHAQRVLKNALEISSIYDINIDVIKASCLIHDLIDHKLDDKHKSSTKQIKEVLIQSQFSTEEITHIFDIIENISYSKGNIPSSLEGKIVQDADRLDALGAIGIARTFAFGGKKGRLIYGPKDDKANSVAHFYDKLFKLTELMNTHEAKELAVKRTAFMEEFILELQKETNYNTLK